MAFLQSLSNCLKPNILFFQKRCASKDFIILYDYVPNVKNKSRFLALSVVLLLVTNDPHTMWRPLEYSTTSASIIIIMINHHRAQTAMV